MAVVCKFIATYRRHLNLRASLMNAPTHLICGHLGGLYFMCTTLALKNMPSRPKCFFSHSNNALPGTRNYFLGALIRMAMLYRRTKVSIQ